MALRCRACGSELPAGSRFCDACGTAVSPATAPPPHQPERTYAPPQHLAERILRDRAQIEGERRTVTVLFIDAVASTQRSERVDPEVLHGVVQSCTERMIEAVNRFEGTVTQFRGDGIMALFGAPIAHEDSARRAISAAIAMRDDLALYAAQLAAEGRPSFEYRIGLNTGPVVVGVIGNDLTMDYTAIGDTVNLAARMEQWAAPNAIYITAATMHSAGGYFELRDLGELEVKGKSEMIGAYEVLRELPTRTRLDASAERGLTPYVGRDLHLSLLRGYFEQAASGQGQVAFVSGEAGMGKSRLLLEFRRSLADRATWLEGRCISWGRNFPYLPVMDIVKGALGGADADDPGLEGRIDALAREWGERGDALVPYLRYLMNLSAQADEEMDPAERHRRILDALRLLMMRESARRPLVVVFEDVHWADELSEEAIAALVDAVASAPVLLMLTYRPGYNHGLGERTYYNRLALRNLPAEASASMVAGVLQDATVPPELQRMIVEKAEGNPFFIEEVTRSLIETGTLRRYGEGYVLARPLDEVRIPNTIQDVLLSRIDRLGRVARETVQRASVIGREFPLALLARVESERDAIGDVMRELVAMELVYEASYEPEPSYIFKHALTQEVALSTLLQERRRALHRAVAEAIEGHYADRLGDHEEALAHHYFEGEDWHRAADFAVRVAARAQTLHAPRAVIEHLTRAIDASARLNMPVEAALYRRRAAAHERVGEFELARNDFETSLQLAEDAGDQLAAWHALAGLGMLWAGRDYARTGQYFEQAHAIARELDDRRVLARSLNRLANWHLNQERLEQAIDLHLEALDIFHELEDRRGIAETCDFLTMATAFTADIFKAEDYGLRAIEIYRELDDKLALATMLPTVNFCGPNGEIETCVSPPARDDPYAFCDEAIELTQTIGFPSGEAYALMQRSISASAFGDYGKALRDSDRAVAIATEIGHRQWLVGSLMARATVRFETEDVDGALVDLWQALPIAQEIRSSHWTCFVVSLLTSALTRRGQFEAAEEVQSLIWAAGDGRVHTVGRRAASMARADLLLAQGRHDEALHIIRALLESAPGAEPDRVHEQIPHVAWRHGRALLQLGDAAGAERVLRAGIAGVDAYRALPIRWRLLADLARARAAQGDEQEAHRLCAEAREIIDKLASSVEDAEARERFVARTHASLSPDASDATAPSPA